MSVAKIFNVALSGLNIELNMFILIIVPLHIKPKNPPLNFKCQMSFRFQGQKTLKLSP